MRGNDSDNTCNGDGRWRGTGPFFLCYPQQWQFRGQLPLSIHLYKCQLRGPPALLCSWTFTQNMVQIKKN